MEYLRQDQEFLAHNHSQECPMTATLISQQIAPIVERVGRLLLALTTAVLGCISLATADFAYTWQPVPEALPGRALLAQLTGMVLIAASVLFLLPRTARVGLPMLAILFWVWLLVLHGPLLFAGTGWLGFAEFMLPASAGLALLWLSGTGRFAGKQVFIAARVMFGLGLIGCGTSHFVYAEPASQMIPAWIPARLFLTYLTGVGHIAAGLSLVSGMAMRLATPLLCFMLACFVFLLHVPRVLGDFSNRFEWTMMIVAILFNGAAWVMMAAVLVQSRERTSE
jgi:uncharacterized membrane protein YphA (DoxX/SURF4 family)